MAYCRNCGAQISDQAASCPRCGHPQRPMASGSQDTGSFGWGVLGFCMPVVGLVLYLVWKDTKPRNSIMAGKGALICVIVTVVLYLLAIILGVIGSMM